MAGPFSEGPPHFRARRKLNAREAATLGPFLALCARVQWTVQC